MAKKSLFDRLPGNQDLQNSINKIRKSLSEDLSVDKINDVFKGQSNFGSTFDGKPITPKDISTEDDYVILGNVNGIVVRQNTKTKEISVVAKDPSKVKINSEEDAKKLDSLSNFIKTSNASNETSVNTNSNTVNAQNAQAQKAEQNSSNSMWEGVYPDTTFDLGDDESDSEEDKELDSDSSDEHKEHEDSESKSEEDSEHKSSITVPLGEPADPMIMIDRIDTMSQSYDYSPEEMLAQVRQAQLNVGAYQTPVQLDRGGSVLGQSAQFAQPRQHTANPAALKITEPIPDSEAFEMQSPVSLKLMLQIG